MNAAVVGPFDQDALTLLRTVVDVVRVPEELAPSEAQLRKACADAEKRLRVEGIRIRTDARVTRCFAGGAEINGGEIIRAVVSTPPPGGQGTIIRIGLEG